MPADTAHVERPWERLRALIRAGDARAIDAYLDSLSPAETARAIGRLAPDERVRLFTLLEPAEAADVLEDVPEDQAADLIDDLPRRQAAAIVDEMQSDVQADVLGRMSAGDAAEIIERMRPEEAADVRELLRHDPDTAGGIMITEVLAYPETHTVQDVIADLRANAERYSDFDVQYVYVVDGNRRLLGVLRLRDLLFAPPRRSVRDVMIGEPVAVRAETELGDLLQIFEQHHFLGIPVVDAAGRLIGVVRRSAVQEAADRVTSRTFLRFTGIAGREELRSMPLLDRSGRRLAWLSINVVLNIVAASVIALYQDTLAQAIVLAVFLPIISDMSGCSGNQAVAVSLRELALGLVRPGEIAHVVAKESAVGLLNGIALGLLLGAIALFWRQNPYLGLVVGGALAINTVIAAVIGGALPLILRGLRFDPALASGPILTTVTDICGFFLVLKLAQLVLPRLAGA